MCKEQFMEAQPFVYDFRRPAICKDKENNPKNYKRWKFPKNYHDIVKYGKIEASEFFGDAKLYLIYGRAKKKFLKNEVSRKAYRYELIKINQFTTKKHFFYSLCISDEDTDGLRLSEAYYEPFGFSRFDFNKYMPVFEVMKTENPNEPYIIVNEPDADEKARNGEVLYRSKFGKRNTTFYVIRNEFGKVEIDKSILSLAFVLSANFFKLLILLITFLPMLLGECLLKKQNIIARIFGVVFYAPFMPIKVVGKFAAALIKIPVLLFVGYTEKYGDCYCTLWKYEIIECFEDFTNGISLIIDGKEKEKKVCHKASFLATWKELNSCEKDMAWMVEHWDEYQKTHDDVV